MHTKIRFATFCLILSLFSLNTQAQSYDELWLEAMKASRMLPQTYISITEQILQKALTEKNSPQVLKAYTAKRMTQEELSPDSIYSNLKFMEKWAAETKQPIDAAILNTILAYGYCRYIDKTESYGKPSKELWQWSSQALIEKAISHINAALQNSETLLNTRTEDYEPFTAKGDFGLYFDHDLYHILFFYCMEAAQEAALADKDVYPFISECYNKAIDLYTQRKNKDAALLLMLEKIKGENPPLLYQKIHSESYLESLEQLITDNHQNELIVEVYIAKIQELIERKRNKEALQICKELQSRFPDYKRIPAVERLILKITQPELNIHFNQSAYPGMPFALNITYYNLDKFNIHLYKITSNNKEELFNIKHYDERTFTNLPSEKISTQEIRLINKGDYINKDTTITIQTPPEGLYRIAIEANDRKGYKTEEEILTVQRLKILSRHLPDSLLEVWVVDEQTGEPVPDATVYCYQAEKGKYQEKEVLKTDKTGKAQVRWGNLTYIKAEKGNDTHMALLNIRRYGTGTQEKKIGIELFTDRAIYRPGQTVYVKGIVYNHSPKISVIKGKEHKVILQDTQGNTIAEKILKTNEFGSFATEFTLPTDDYKEEYYLRCEDGSAYIKVEEYKRPSFNITFLPQKEAYRIGDSILVQGNVKTFSGVPIEEISVHYQITGDNYNGVPLFKAGEVTLNKNGDFYIPVHLKADVNGTGERKQFSIKATATHITGETQTSETRKYVKQNFFTYNSNFFGWINRDDSIKIAIQTTNWDAQPIKTTGTYQICPYTDYSAKTTAQPVLTGSFVSGTAMNLNELKEYPSGAYKVVLKGKDEKGHEVSDENTMILFSLKDTKPVIHSHLWTYVINKNYDKKQPISFIVGTSQKDVCLQMDIVSKKKTHDNRVIHLSDTLLRFDLPYKEVYGEEVTVHLSFVKDGKVYNKDIDFKKKTPSKDLKLSWEVFRDKLKPRQEEEWKLSIKDANGKPVRAELLAMMYDASLDKIRSYNRNWQMPWHYRYNRLPHLGWYYNSHRFNSNRVDVRFENTSYIKIPSTEYDHFWNRNILGGEFYGKRALSILASCTTVSRSNFSADTSNSESLQSVLGKKEDGNNKNGDTAPLILRSDFKETAFFHPFLRTNKEGETVFSFTLPEGLTSWRFLGFAHTKQMQTGSIEGQIISQKEFMLTSNIPRFIRTGDETTLTAAVTNLMEKDVSGIVTFTLFNPETEEVIATQQKDFTTASGKKSTVTFPFTPTDEYDLVGVRMIASAEGFSDGEQHRIPVLSNKETVVETMSVTTQGKQTYQCSLTPLLEGDTLAAKNRRLTIEFTGNPAWYAVQALPTQTKPAQEDAISQAAAYYANTLTAHIAKTQPDIQTQTSTIAKLKNLQLYDGSWTWFQGMKGNQSVTCRIVEMLLRLESITGEALPDEILTMRNAAFRYLHSVIRSKYRQKIVEEEIKKQTIYPLSYQDIEYLYLIAISNDTIPKENESIYNHLMAKISNVDYCSFVRPLSLKAKIAITLYKAGEKEKAHALIASLKEYAVQTKEQGMYFALKGYYGYSKDIKIPMHVAVMEAIDLIEGNTEVIEQMKIWLLKQKQVQQWDSPIATVDAIYALLNRGENPLDNQGDVELQLGNKTISTKPADKNKMPGLSYIKEVVDDPVLLANTKSITVKKKDNGLAWGSISMQSLKSIRTTFKDNEALTIKKELFLEKVSETEKKLIPITNETSLKVGDKVVIRLTLFTDRPMDFIQVKDQRAACFEPVEQSSGHRYAGKVGYYKKTKDTSTLFFLESMNQGAHLLEYSCYVNRSGSYESGLASVQSTYSPEFVSYAPSERVYVEK
ncbi:alpha-2-macroglobulin family protein [Bacteroides sp. 224]|uniref:alpha-2-macroglobulin family protein n=1 Tax=Bacteroides sp. 224 TaxID=2302936 RepID=UPI0013D68A49|nr:alpha-2-macroglobulin family protein [Bacteroides sp. 224]NDV65672.1 hypothetical protein [Bacteroides sp. 224]